MKVAHVVGKMKAGGVESVVFAYLANMDRTGMDIDVLYDADSTVAPPRELAEAGIRFIEIPPYQKLPVYIKAIKELCRKNGYDIVHSHLNSLSGFPLYAAKRGGVKVRIAHNHTTSSKAERKRDLAKRALRPLARRYATNYAACSENAGRWLYGDGIFDSGKVKVFANAVDTDKFRFSPASRDAARRELGVGERFVLLHVGRFVTVKNHPFIIDVFRELKKLVPDAVLVLVGDGELEERIKALASSRGLSRDVIFCGAVSDAERYYSAADAFVLPSLYEGLPVVAVEAQASGLPCFISDGVTRECAVTSGVHFLPLDAGGAAWAKAVSEEAARDRLADNEAVRSSRFNIKTSASEMRAYYDGILSRLAEVEK